MITLKAALIAASAIGTVAVGGGATWAMTGSHQDAALQSNGAKAPAAERKLQDAAPAPVPTCLPAKSALPKTGLPNTDLPEATLPDAGANAKKQVEKEVEKRLDQNRTTTDLPEAGVPGVKAPDAKTKLPADLPTCAPSTEDLPKGAPVDKPSARVPAKPGLPAVPELDCSKLTPAVKVGGPVEKTVMLTKGLRHVSTSPSSADLRKKNICAVTQKWTGRAGQWITVETLKTPAGMTQNQLRQALDLPKGGTSFAAHGMTGWVAPGGAGVLVSGPNGRSLFVNGSPVLAGDLKNVTAALSQAG